MTLPVEFIVEAADEGIRLDRWLKRHYPDVTHSLWQKWLRQGLVKLEGKKTETSARLTPGQRITLRLPEEFIIATPHRGARPAAPIDEREQQSSIRAFKKMILFEDADIAVINKPAGLAVQGGSKQTQHIDRMLQALAQQTGKERYRLVHRIDQDTSGILVLAKNATSATWCTKQWANHTVEKKYLALVCNVPEPRKGTVNLALEKGEGMAREKMHISEEGKSARTEYRVVDHAGSQYALVELQPLTGRTHQLRVHMAALHCPIYGDGKYGGRNAFQSGLSLAAQLHLHAHKISLPRPKGKPLLLTAPLPPHMKESLELLGMSVGKSTL